MSEEMVFAHTPTNHSYFYYGDRSHAAPILADIYDYNPRQYVMM